MRVRSTMNTAKTLLTHLIRSKQLGEKEPMGA
jgi:hypothetical protein